MEPKYCIKCGKPIESNKKKCSECRKKQTKKIFLIILAIISIRLIVFGIELSIGMHENIFKQDLKISENENQIEYKRFNGYYTNDGKHEKNQIVEKILSAIENQLIEDPQIISGTTYKDFIYYFVEDPNDCSPSKELPIYSVIVKVSGEGLIDENNYWISYIIGISNDDVLELSFEMSETFEDIQILDVTLRDKISFWFEDFSQEEMRKKVVDLAVQITPNLCSGNSTNIDVNKTANEPNSVNTSTPLPIYLFPSDTIYITENDLKGLSKYEIALIRNEIYARHGYIFKQEKFKTYFNTQSWYHPNETFSASSFNKIERANIDFIVNYEKKLD